MTGAIERLLREHAPIALGVLVRRCRDFAAAEDALQEALLAASIQWPVDGLPDSPRAWLIQVGARRLTDAIRADQARRRREADSAIQSGYVMPAEPQPAHDEDDALVLIHLCCHPALTTASAIALTLRAVGGLTTAEIARAFLVPEPTIAQRISRAKQTIRDSRIPFRMPESPADRARNLRSVLHVLYLIFNEGYAASEGPDLFRPDLAAEAIRMARLVHARTPGDPDIAGLLALMLLTDARRAARLGPSGEVIPLDHQDRALWNREQIAEGVALIASALRQGSVGQYQLQAAIAAVHDEASSFDRTDWPQILALYEVLLRISDNPVVRLNHAVAAAMVKGPAHGLRLLEALDADPKFRNHHRLHAVRAHLLERDGRIPEAIESYQSAAAGAASLPERTYLLTQAARLRDDAKIQSTQWAP